jgi:hypothetical protein
MLQNHVQSAPILEDDADWDAFLRLQLIGFARGVRSLANSTRPAWSPFGDEWDVLTIGHTGISNVLEDQMYWVTRDDPIVTTESRRTWGRKRNLSAAALNGEYSRVVLRVSELTGTAAYAISQRGAARILHDQVMFPNAVAIDFAIFNMCWRNTFVTSFCYGAYPMLVGRYQAIRPKVRDSDRRTSSNKANPGTGGGQSHADRQVAESEFTVFPVSLNVGRLLRREKTVLANNAKKDMVKEADLIAFLIPKGEAIWVRKNEYYRPGTSRMVYCRFGTIMP